VSENPSESPPQEETEDVPELDDADPLRREAEDELPGLDPTLTIPPE
jgi:hypothetical protein